MLITTNIIFQKSKFVLRYNSKFNNFYYLILWFYLLINFQILHILIKLNQIKFNPLPIKN